MGVCRAGRAPAGWSLVRMRRQRATDASYYRRLVRNLVANAATAGNPTLAERFRQRARECPLIAETLEDTRPPQPPQSDQPAAQQQQQQQQARHKRDDS